MVTRSHLSITPEERILQMAATVDIQELTAEKAMVIMQEVGRIILKSPDMPPAAITAIELLCKVISFQTREASMRLHSMAERLNESLAMRRQLEIEVAEGTKDKITGLLNQQAFRRYADAFFEFHKENGKALNFLLVDIDFFKSINDTFGHDAGDAVLEQMGEIMRQTLRISDFAFQKPRNGNEPAEGVPETVGARDGGEEFAIMLGKTDLPGAKTAAERLRTAVEKADFVLPDGQKIKITISVGVAEADFEKDEDFGALRKRTDLALYKAKGEGRNMSAVSRLTEDGGRDFEIIHEKTGRKAHRYEKINP